ncbi:MAG: flippase [Chromatiaceae bacterium]|nr:flippase [Chromatiaceae bacterium]
MAEVKKSTFARNVAATLLRLVGVGLMQLALVAIIARYYGPQGNGVYTVALLLPTMLATFLNLGIGPANVYFISRGDIGVRHAWRSTLAVIIVASVIGLLSGAVAIYYAQVLFPGVSQDILVLALACFPFLLFTTTISAFFQAVEKFRLFNFVYVSQPVIALAGLGYLVISDETSLLKLFVMYLLSVILSAIIALSIFNRHILQSAKLPEAVIDNYSKKMLAYGIKSHTSNIITFLNYRLDIFLVNFMLNPVQAGIYSIAVQLSERLWMLSQAASTVLLPKLAAMLKANKQSAYLASVVFRLILMLTLVGAILFIIIGFQLIELLFGQQFVNSYYALLWLLPGIVVGAGSRILSNDIAARGKPEINLYISIGVLVINTAANLLLIPVMGIIGAAIATSLAYMFNFLLKVCIFARLNKVPVISMLFNKDKDLAVVKAYLKRHK